MIMFLNLKILFTLQKKKQDKTCKTVLTQTDATAAYSTTKGPFYDVRNLPLEVVSEDSHLMPLIIYQVCFSCCNFKKKSPLI